MLVRGTEKMDGEQIAETADRMGGSIDAYGDADYSEITATALSRNWPEMLELVGDVALRPTLPAGTVQAVRDFIVRQIRNRGDKPFDVASDKMRAALFGSNPYAWDPLGRPESVEKLDRAALLAYYKRYYVPGQMVLAVSGDVKPGGIVSQVSGSLAACPAGRSEPPPVPAPPAMAATRDVFVIARRPGPDPHGRPSRGAHASRPSPLKVLTSVLGGGIDLASSPSCATSGRWPNHAPAQSLARRTQAYAILGTAPENVAKAEPALVEQLERIRNQQASAEEVAVARAYVLGSQAMDRRTNARQAWYLAFYEIAGVGYEFLDRYAADVKKVTPADVQRVAQKYLGVLRTVIVQPK
jgi:zinc protease